MAPKQQKDGPNAKAPHTSRVEWIVAGISTLMVLGVIGFLVYDGVGTARTPPDITIVADSIVPAGPGYLVELKARNRGRSTAANVVIEGELEADGRRLETSHTTIDYVPAGGVSRAGLYFAHDPRRSELRLRALGYHEP